MARKSPESLAIEAEAQKKLEELRQIQMELYGDTTAIQNDTSFKNPAEQNVGPFETYMPSESQQPNESNYAFEKRQYSDAGMSIPDDMYFTGSGQIKAKEYRDDNLLTGTVDALKYFFSPMPAIKDYSKKIKEYLEKNPDVDFAMSDPTLATMDQSGMKEEIQKVPIEEKILKGAKGLAAPFVAMGKNYSRAALNDMVYQYSGSEEDKEKFLKSVSELGLINTMQYFMEPLSVPYAAVAAPFAHDYTYSDFFGGTVEAVGASFEGMYKSMFPTYGEINDYGYKIADKYFPGASESYKRFAAGVFDLVLDPTISASLGVKGMMKAGVQITRAEIKAGITPTKSPLRKAFEAYLNIEDLDEAESAIIRQNMVAAEAGDKEAMKKINEALKKEQNEEWVKRVHSTWFREFRKAQEELYNKTTHDLKRELWLETLEDSKDKAIRIETAKKIKVLQKQFPHRNVDIGLINKEIENADKLVLLGDKEAESYRKYMRQQKSIALEQRKEFKKLRNQAYRETKMDVQTRPLDKRTLAKLEDEVNFRADMIEANKINQIYDRAIDYDTPKGRDELRKLLMTKEGHKALKVNIQKINAGNYDAAMGSIFQEYVRMYKSLGGGQTTRAKMRAASYKVHLESILQQNVPGSLGPEELLAAGSLFQLVDDEVDRLADLIRLSPDAYVGDAYTHASNLEVRLVATITRDIEKWGQKGHGIDELYSRIGVGEKFQDRLARAAKIEQIDKTTNLKKHAELYKKAKKQGAGTGFITRVGRAMSIRIDALYEQYINSILSAIHTSKTNINSTAAHLVAQPLVKFASGMVTFDKIAFGESIEMAAAAAEGFRDSWIYYASSSLDKLDELKLTRNVDITKTKDYFGFKMLRMNDKYPEHIMMPFQYVKKSKGKYAHEIDKIMKRKAISSYTWGVDPTTKKGKALDIYGKFIRGPSAAMKLEDAGFKFIAYNMSARAQAYRRVKESGKKFANRAEMRKAIDKITYSADQTLKAEASKFADYVTFQKELGEYAKKYQSSLQNKVTRWFFPFYVTPINIAKVAVEWTPLGYGVALKRHMQGNRIEKNMAITRATLGTGAIVSTMLLLGEEDITGSYDFRSDYGRKMRSLNIPPYSMRFGDTYYSYENIEFLKGTIGLVATGKRVLGQLNFENPEDYDLANQVVATMVIPFSKMVLDERWNQEFGRLMYYLDTTRDVNEPPLNVFLRGVGRTSATTIIPYSNLMKEFNQVALDNEFKMAMSFMDQLKQRVPGLSADLPAYRNLWGDPILATDQTGPELHHTLKEYFEPIDIRSIEDKLMYEKLIKLPLNLSAVTWRWKGVRLTPHQISEVQRLTGKGLPGEPSLKQTFMDIMSQDVYKNAPPAGQARLLEIAHSAYKEAALQKVRADSASSIGPDRSLHQKILDREMWKQEMLYPQDRGVPIDISR